ncbi:hypothetical protein HMPREF0023_0826 [Acinetobacter sp. ATCC 27244]|uniref:SDR family NAD(P)-dependent oxidoreductase n=1 Tax=Acinetobacter sp. (strain ATCC 27244 / 9458) TaxID=525244 RepID=UPI00019AE007|nr:SDR family NAD(P)-dependent oxidoreductase [Acinetobacter sp. ATCC 27244]EEH69647.1 hypothetical protein HMPREF0023_0826 [Acinetobacter sp. ATCC 27244]
MIKNRKKKGFAEMLNENKKAVIFGGSGVIGGAVAQALIREGVKIYLVARNQKKLEKFAKELCAMGGNRGNILH